jgi:hypothetical protein
MYAGHSGQGGEIRNFQFAYETLPDGNEATHTSAGQLPPWHVLACQTLDTNARAPAVEFN